MLAFVVSFELILHMGLGYVVPQNVFRRCSSVKETLAALSV